MDLKLKNKTAFISGSGAGIGLSIALGLAKEGAIVYINAPSQSLIDDALKKIKKNSWKFMVSLPIFPQKMERKQ